MVVVLQMKLPPRQWVGLFFIFSLGLFVAGAGFTRLYYSYKAVYADFNDFTWYGYPSFVSLLMFSSPHFQTDDSSRHGLW